MVHKALKSYAVIIPSFRSSTHLINTIRSIINATSLNRDKWRLRILVIVNYQTNNKVLSFIETLLKKNEINYVILNLPSDRGLLFMRFIGTLYASLECRDCEYFVFIDDDVFITSNALAYCFSYLENHNAVGITSCVTRYLNSTIQCSRMVIDISMRSIPLKHELKDPVTTIYSPGCFLVVHRRALKPFLYATYFYKLFPFWFEDVIIGLHLLKFGFRNVILPCSIYHVGGSSYRNLSLKDYSKRVFKDQYRDRLKTVALVTDNALHIIVAFLLISMDCIIFGLTVRGLGIIHGFMGLLEGLKFMKNVRIYRFTLPNDRIINSLLIKMVKLHIYDLTIRILNNVNKFMKTIYKFVRTIIPFFISF